MPVVKDSLPNDQAVPAFSRYTLPVDSSDNFDGSDRKLAAPGLTPENEIESGESKSLPLRAEYETTGGNFSNRLGDGAARKSDRNYSLRSISFRK